MKIYLFNYSELLGRREVMASFRQHKNGTWEYRIRYKDPITQKYRETSKRGFATKKEARIAALEMERKLNYTAPITHKMTFRDVFDEWWPIHSRTVKKSTRYTKKSKFHGRILGYFGKMKINEITPNICQEFVNRLDKEIESVNDFKIQANLIFDYAKSKGYINENPMVDVIVPKKEKEFLADTNEEEKRNFFFREEKNEFLKLVDLEMSKLDYFMFFMLINFGLRKGELLALEWDDIDLINRTLKINKTLFFENKQEIFQKTKNYATRELPIGKNQLKVINKWKVQQKELLLANGIRKDPKYVLCRNDLRPLRLAYPNDALKRFYRMHKDFHRITVHGMRHTFASIAFEAGATPKEVQVLLGHKDIQTTMNIYIHVTNFQKIKVIEKINKVMDSI